MSTIYNAVFGSLSTQQIAIAALTAIAGILVLEYVLGKKKRLPPGPRGLPLIGHLHMLAGSSHVAVTTLAKKYGHIVLLRMGSHPAVFISSVDMAKEVLKEQDQHFASRPSFVTGKILAYDNQSTSLAPYGEKWRFMRKIISQELVSAKRIEQAQHIRVEEVYNTLEEILTEGQKGELVDFDTKLAQMVLNQTTRFNFSRSYYGKKRDTVESNAEEFQGIVKLLGGTPFFLVGEFFPYLLRLDIGGVEKKMRAQAEKADLFYSKIVDGHRRDEGKNAAKPKDFVDVILAHQKDPKNKINDGQIKAAIQDIIVASSSTSTASMLWILAELLKEPAIMRKLQQELDDVVGRDRLVEESDLVNLPYLKCVVKEVFRLHPVLPLLVPHYNEEERSVGGYDIPAKCLVFVNVYAIGRDPQIWRDPLLFNPDRFKDSKMDVKGQNFELLPFGAGRRMCVGYNLGLITVEYGLAQLCHALEISLPEGMNPKDLRMSESPGTSVTREDPLLVRVAPRLPSHVYEKAGIAIAYALT
ncbi:hypothetical protein Mapa_000977 [Marchantia paleacea]|nr:hypothetical protein Mapa_000977 [Marchantia paleacea]